MKENYWILGGKIDTDTDTDFIRQHDKEQVPEDSNVLANDHDGQQQARHLRQPHNNHHSRRHHRANHNGSHFGDPNHDGPLAGRLQCNNMVERAQPPRAAKGDRLEEDSLAGGLREPHEEAAKDRATSELLHERLDAEGDRERDSIGSYRDGLEVRRPDANNREEPEVNLSFCGCGFLGIYHVGVASCFHQYAPQLSMHKISGSSAGALVAVAHICGNLQLAYATTDILRVAIDARARALGPFHPSFDIQATVREALERGLPDDVHLKASGKLHISLTRAYDGENVVVSEFDSKEEVIQALLCSCFIPFWSGFKAPKFRGVTYIDGGFSLNLLILDDKTVSVSPFAGEADICPQDDTLNLLQISLSNTSFSLSPNNLYRLSHALLPPSPEVLSDLCEQGFADGIRFLQQMKLISCTKCLEIRSSLLVTTNGEDMEEAFAQEVNSSELVDGLDQYENHHIRLEQQEQKMIEITGSQRRNSVVSTNSPHQQQQQQQQQQQSSSGQQQQSHSQTGVGGYSGGGGDDDGGRERCRECARMRLRASSNLALPSQFSDRIRDACDAVNKSLSNWIYSYRPIKYLAYLAAPYYLPLDLSLALVLRCWQQLPQIRSELFTCFVTIAEFVIKILKQMHSRSMSRLLMSDGQQDDEVDQLDKVKGADNNGCHSDTTYARQANCWLDEDAHQHEKRLRMGSRRSCNMMEPSLAASATSLNEPASCSSFDAISSHSSTHHGDDSISVRITSDGVCVSKLRNSRCSSTTHLHSLEDTFDSIVDVTSNQEARIFAYYFRDAKNRLKVTEIFDLELQKAVNNSSSNNNQDHQQSQQPPNLSSHRAASFNEQ